jgi:hypothetical protein
LIRNKDKFTKTVLCEPFIDHLGWARILYRADNIMNLTYNGTLTASDITNMNIKDIAFSDNEYSAVTNESWYIENVQFSTNTNLPLNQVIANVFNGKTPTGTEWNLKYAGGYLYYSGIIKTYGDFKSFYMGANWKAHITIGTQSSLRTGGHPHHTGEFIHSSCNGYSDKDHSITNRIGWKSKRVFWVR